MFMDLLNVREWMYHYEVVIRRHGRDQLLARVPTRRSAELTAARARREIEVSRQDVQWRRARGVHPHKVAILCTLPLLVVIGLPMFWLRIALGIVVIALICGLLSSGSSWRRGGVDDR